jgi:hypothetical protein
VKRNARLFSLLVTMVMVCGLASPFAQPGSTYASNPSSGTLNPPAGNGTVSLTWTGGPFTNVNPTPQVTPICPPGDLSCDTYTFTWNAPANYWSNHEGSITVEIGWPDASDDFDMYIFDSEGNRVDQSATGNTPEKVNLQKLPPGTYTVEIIEFLVTDATYTGTITLTTTEIPPGMIFPENKDTIMDLLTVDYPVNVIFVGYQPTAQEVAEVKRFVPKKYQPTVAQQSPSGDEIQNSEAGLLNWNKNHLITSNPYFLGIRYNYQVRIIQASEEYARALFQVAEDNTAQSQSYKAASRGQDVARYDALYGQYRVLAKNGDLSYRVADPTKTDLIDAYAVEDWIFNTRNEARWSCAFKNLETNECLTPSILQPDPTAYHDPFYDKNGLNLDRMPQGLNKGSSFLFLDTFMPAYAGSYFRTNAYHTWGTDKVIGGTIVQRSIDQGGSWRITDPDTGGWDGVDYARTWGGRYRFHFIDLGAAPNNYESISWLGTERQLSSDYPHGDPPIWQYKADARWQQSGTGCAADPQVINYTGNTPCRLMPRLGRDVAYGLFFRSTAGYLYRPIPRGDVNWLATSNWTDFYSRPQWVNGQLTNTPWYGTWWTNPDPLYKINVSGAGGEDVLRWLSSALPYTRWVGRKNEVIPIYDPTNNQPSGRNLDTSPKYADLPAPKYHVQQGATGLTLVPEPLYPGDNNEVIAQYGPSQVNLTRLSNAFEKAKATGIGAGTYDGAVSDTFMRDYIDANRPGIADVLTHTSGYPIINTIPSVNMVFEKALTWALPVIVGGKAIQDKDGEAWGVFNNVNDRFKWSGSHYPAVQSGDPPGSKRSMTNTALPTQDSGTGFSYTVEHEAAHNLGLSHPHDGSYGVDECPAGSPNAGQWECYWSGLGYMYDISAAPTTYAMSYRPYEVEDQDNLQRGRVAEYLLAGQKALVDRLVVEARAGRTTPTAEWSSDYERMKQWRTQAAALFRSGDYLHAEYAARNAAIAARGLPQTAANTINPSLLEAGQVFYFNVHPQSDGLQRPDLIVANIVATQDRPGSTVLTAAVSNVGTASASNVVVRLLDGQTVLNNSAPVATLAAGATAQVSYTWNTRGLNGNHVITAIADPANTVAESAENNNQAQRTITIRGNKVTNGSFEQSSSSTAPSAWSGSQGTSYDTSGANASDGTRSAKASGSGGPATALNPAWTSNPIAVTAGGTYNLAMTVKTQGLSSSPSLNVTFLNAAGSVVSTVTGITTSVTGTGAAQQVLGQVTIPAGITQVRLKLVGFSPTDLTTGGTVWFDDVWMW